MKYRAAHRPFQGIALRRRSAAASDQRLAILLLAYSTQAPILRGVLRSCNATGSGSMSALDSKLKLCFERVQERSYYVAYCHQCLVPEDCTLEREIESFGLLVAKSLASRQAHRIERYMRDSDNTGMVWRRCPVQRGTHTLFNLYVNPPRKLELAVLVSGNRGLLQLRAPVRRCQIKSDSDGLSRPLT